MTVRTITGGVRLTVGLVHAMTLVLGVAATYFLTIQSIKLDLAAKAEGGVVETLDKKLTNFEVFLKEGVVSKEQFYQFSTRIESRLTRIELYLKDKPGDNLGKR
ncbi:MAG: hypothetical protein ACE5FH_09100 [Candidatus Zixiibacteriota bacterium]